MSMLFGTWVCAGCVLRLPDGESDSAPDDPGTSTTTATTTTGEAPPTTDAPTGTDTTAGPGTTTGQSPCGDGVLDAGEFCDDGNGVDGDGCNADCRPSAELLWEFRSQIFTFDRFRDVAVVGDDTIVAGGEWLGEGAWLTRFTGEGEGVWSQTFDIGVFAAIQGLVADDEAIDVVGMKSTDDQRDAWIARLDLEGTIVWEETVASGLGDDFLTDVSRTPEGDVVIAGVRSVGPDLGEVWVRRHGPDGAVQWTHTQAMNSGPLYELGPSVVAAADQVVVGFHTAPPDPFGELLFALRPDDGEPLWSQAAPMSTNMVMGVQRAPGGDIVTSGLGALVRRSSSTGESSWSRTACMAEGRGRDVAVDGQGDIIVIGDSFGQIFLCKFTPTGEPRWERTIAGEGFGSALALLPDNRIVAAGEVENGDTADAWLAVFSP